MRILITGVAGFCGPHLIQRLRQDSGADIAGMDFTPLRAAQIGLDQYFQADIRDRAAVISAVARFRPHALFHLAGIGGRPAQPSASYAANVMGTLHVLEAARSEADGCRILMTGSAAEYGVHPEDALPITENTACHPVGPYGVSKYAATLAALDFARQSGLKVVVARPFNIIGAGIPTNLVAGAIMARAKEALSSPGDPVVKVGDSDSERDFVAAADAVDAYVRLLESEAWGEAVNICSGQACSIRCLAEMLLANSQRSIRIDFDPNLVPPSPVRRIYGSYAKANRLIGFQPATTLEQVLKSVWESALGTTAKCA